MSQHFLIVYEFLNFFPLPMGLIPVPKAFLFVVSAAWTLKIGKNRSFTLKLGTPFQKVSAKIKKCLQPSCKVAQKSFWANTIVISISIILKMCVFVCLFV